MFNEIKSNNVSVTKRIETLKQNIAAKYKAFHSEIDTKIVNFNTHVRKIEDEIQDKLIHHKKTIQNLAISGRQHAH